MKNRITIKSGVDVLNFYLVNQYGSYYLFTQKYTRGVYEYFRDGRSENEVRSFRDWELNPRLDKTIEKLPMYIRFVMKEYVAADREAARRAESSRTKRIRQQESYKDWEYAA